MISPYRSRTYPTLSAHLPPGDLTLTPRSQQPPHQKYGQVPVNFMGVQFKIPYTDPLPQKFLRLSEPLAPALNSPLVSYECVLPTSLNSKRDDRLIVYESHDFSAE